MRKHKLALTQTFTIIIIIIIIIFLGAMLGLKSKQSGVNSFQSSNNSSPSMLNIKLFIQQSRQPTTHTSKAH